MNKDSDVYGSIFASRHQILAQQERFTSVVKVRKDDDMWNYNIKNNYEYSVLKL